MALSFQKIVFLCLALEFLLVCKPCHTGGMLLASACSTCINMGNVPELADLVPLKRTAVITTRFSEQMHRRTVNSPMCKTKFYQSSFFLVRQPFGTPSRMNAVHQITNSQYPSGKVKKFMLLK